MSKKIVALLFLLAMLVGVLPSVSPQVACADQESQYYIDFNIDFSGFDGIKIGQRARDVRLEGMEITAATDLKDRAFTDSKPNAKQLELTVKLDPNSIQVRGNSEHGSEFISLKNIFMADVTVTAGGNLDQLQNNTHRIKFRVNGVEATGCSISSESVALRQEGGNAATGEMGHTVTDFKVSINCGFELTGRTYYKIKKANDKNIAADADIGWNMPKLAEPGLTVTFYDCLYGAGISDKVEYHTVNGERIDHEETFVMPNKDVEVGIVLKGGGGGTSKPKLVSKLDITLDFENTDIDIYNGKKAPTASDLKKAIKLSANVKNSGAKVKEAFVDEIYDESFYAQEDYEEAEKWAGNLLLTFKVGLASGYTFSDADVSADDRLNWQEKNVDITLNGKKLHLMQGGLQYAGGYFVTEYYMSGYDEIEVHVLWYGVKDADFDISDKKVGDRVDIPDSAFNYKGYFVYKYVLSYTEPENGQTHFDNVDGKSFTMPASDKDGVKLMVKYLRGDGSTLTSITKDAAGKIELTPDNAEFPQNTVVSVNKLSPSKDGQKCQLAQKALGEMAKAHMLFDISAHAYNLKVQPDGRVIATFPIPEGYDEDHLMFCYISDDGVQEILLEVDKTKNVGIAVLEHFSLYAIVSTKDATDNSQHVIHIVSPVPQKKATCTENGHKAYFECGCGKIFSDINAKNEITRESVVLFAGHADEDKNSVCDNCQQEVSPEDLPSVTPEITGTSEGTATPENTQAEPTFSPAGDVTQKPADTHQPSVKPTEADREDSGGSGTILAIAVPVVAVIAIAIAVVALKKKQKKA